MRALPPAPGDPQGAQLRGALFSPVPVWSAFSPPPHSPPPGEPSVWEPDGDKEPHEKAFTVLSQAGGSSKAPMLP